MQSKENQETGIYRITGTGDFVLANRIAYEFGLQGPSLVYTFIGRSLMAHANIHGFCQDDHTNSMLLCVDLSPPSLSFHTFWGLRFSYRWWHQPCADTRDDGFHVPARCSLP